MTSDAKIGLLLGLVFIFLIAFIINGLPRFNNDNEESIEEMVSLPNNPPGLGAKEHKAQASFNWIEPLNQTEPIKNQYLDAPQSTPADTQQDTEAIRSIIPLTEPPSFVKENSNVNAVDKSNPFRPIGPPPTAQKNDVSNTQSSKMALPKIYVVKEGDSLADIAKKVYGPEQGNKRANVMRIFQANRKILQSPDEIYVGQILTIPPLPAAETNKKTIEEILSPAMFKQVESIGRRHLSTDSSSAQKNKWYIVKEGDSLWKIAVEMLGDGSRYKEISKINADTLPDEDSLDVGMRLRIPAR